MSTTSQSIDASSAVTFPISVRSRLCWMSVNIPLATSSTVSHVIFLHPTFDFVHDSENLVSRQIGSKPSLYYIAGNEQNSNAAICDNNDNRLTATVLSKAGLLHSFLHQGTDLGGRVGDDSTGVGESLDLVVGATFSTADNSSGTVQC